MMKAKIARVLTILNYQLVKIFKILTHQPTDLLKLEFSQTTKSN
jgi:hypothetical protein